MAAYRNLAVGAAVATGLGALLFGLSGPDRPAAEPASPLSVRPGGEVAADPVLATSVACHVVDTTTGKVSERPVVGAAKPFRLNVRFRVPPKHAVPRQIRLTIYKDKRDGSRTIMQQAIAAVRTLDDSQCEATLEVSPVMYAGTFRAVITSRESPARLMIDERPITFVGQ